MSVDLYSLAKPETPEELEEREKIRADKQARSEVVQRFNCTNKELDSLRHGKQYLVFSPFYSDDWMALNAWDVETAIKLITIGYPINLNASWWNDSKSATGALNQALYALSYKPPSLFDTETLKQFNRVYSRALSLVKSAIAIGKIKATDTPLNWIAWANAEDYSTFHLSPLTAIRAFEYLQSQIDYENCNETYRKEIESYQEQIKGWQKIADIWGLALANEPAKAEPMADAGAVKNPVQPDKETAFDLKLEALRRWMISKGLEPNDSKSIFLKHHPELKYTTVTIYSELCSFDSAFYMAKATFEDFWQEQKLLKFK